MDRSFLFSPAATGLVVLSLLVASRAGASDCGGPDRAPDMLDQWHQWRGPLATGEAPRGHPPVHWSDKDNVLWKLPLPGSGSATPIVWQDHVLVVAAVETDRRASPAEMARNIAGTEGQITKPPERYYRFLILDVDRRTGAIRWQRNAAEELPQEGHQVTNTYASASPITDGTHVFVSFGSHGIYCYTFDGELQWHRRLGQMRTRHGWGEGASPALLHGRALLVNWDHEGQSFLVALDAATGEVKWQVDREEPTSWSTPLIVPGNDRTQVIVSASNRVRSYDVENGQLIWQCGGLTTNVIASPVATSDAAICMSWYGQASVLALPLDASGDLTDSDRLAWRYDQMAPYCPSPLLLDNRLYFLHANSNVFACLDAANGKPLAPPRRLAKIDGDVYASPVAAGGRIYFVNREGTTGVYQAGPELELLSTNELNEPVDASPAIAGPQMFLRGHKHLFCIQEGPQ